MLTKIGERLAVKTRDDCSEEFTVEELDDGLSRMTETINRQCEIVVLLHSAVQVSWNDNVYM